RSAPMADRGGLVVDHQLELHAVHAGRNGEVRADRSGALEIDVAATVDRRDVSEDRSTPAVAEKRLELECVVTGTVVVTAPSPVLREERRRDEENSGEKQ